ncbi:MAG: response regulator transcription factor [Actinobacteria bacterium]|nr:response regulator transcription factor [Actinomycetota bacterium]
MESDRNQRVVIADDHTLVRQSLVKLVNSEPGFEVVADVERGEPVPDLVRRHDADLVLLDVNMPDIDGITVATKLRKQFPDVRILFLTMHDDDATIRRAVSLGADGYVSKSASTEELVHALETVGEGGTYLSPAIARRVMEMAGGRGDTPASQLTERELEILQLMATGARPQEMADTLFLSVKTIKNHLTNVYAKLGVSTAAQAVAEAYRLGIVSHRSD